MEDESRFDIPREEVFELRAIEAELKVLELEFLRKADPLHSRRREMVQAWVQRFGVEPGSIQVDLEARQVIARLNNERGPNGT